MSAAEVFTEHDLIRTVLKKPVWNVEQLREYMYGLADGSPAACRRLVEAHPFFLQIYLGFDVEPFHREGLDTYLNCMRSMWLAPRGSGKSTDLVVMAAWFATSHAENRLPEHRNLFPEAPRDIGPDNIRIALTSNSADKAIELHWQVRNLLQDGRMQLLYGDLVGKRWTDHKSTTALRDSSWREGTFTALGLGSKVTGGHYDVVLVDDWVTEDNARTELQRQRLLDFWAKTVKPTCEPWARVMGAGTRYHPQDFYRNVYQWVEAGLWDKLLRHRALEEVRGKLYSYWPKAYSVEKLLRIKEEIGSVAFATQYQNEVDVMQGDFFKMENFEHTYVWDELPAVVRKACEARTIITLDSAIKAGPKNDYSVFTVMSYAAPNFYVREMRRGQWTDDEHVEILRQLVQSYRPQEVGIELVGGVEFLVQRLRKLPWCPRIIALRPQQYRGKDKVGRASAVRVFFESGRVRLPESTSVTTVIQRFIEEALAFPTSSNVPGMDDCVDSVVWGLLLITRARNRLVRTQRRRR